MASTLTVCLSDRRLHVQERVHEPGERQVEVQVQVQVQSCQGLDCCSFSPPTSHLPPPPENGSVLLLLPSLLSPHPCAPAHLLRTCPLQNQSLAQVSDHPQNPQEN